MLSTGIDEVRYVSGMIRINTSKFVSAIFMVLALVATSITFGLTRIANANGSSNPSPFIPLTPARIIDTRSNIGGVGYNKVGAVYGSGGSIQFFALGRGGIPSSGVNALSLNLTVVDTEAPDSGGFATAYPCGAIPNASNINFQSRQIIANAVIVPVSASGTVCFAVYGRAHLIVDVNGYYASVDFSESYYDIQSGDLFLPTGSYLSGFLYCPMGTFAISSNYFGPGLISTVKLYDDYSLYFLSNDLLISTDVEAQLTCAGPGTGALSTSISTPRTLSKAETREAEDFIATLSLQAQALGLVEATDPLAPLGSVSEK